MSAKWSIQNVIGGDCGNDRGNVDGDGGIGGDSKKFHYQMWKICVFLTKNQIHKTFFLDFKSECKNILKIILKSFQFHFYRFVSKITFKIQKPKTQPPQRDHKFFKIVYAYSLQPIRKQFKIFFIIFL